MGRICEIVISTVPGKNRVVEIRDEELPEDPQALCSLMRAGDAAPLAHFAAIAIAYHRQGRAAAFQKVLQAGMEESKRRSGSQGGAVAGDAMAMYSMLACHHVAVGMATRDRSEASACFDAATRLVNEGGMWEGHGAGGSSSGVGVWFAKGLLSIVKGTMEGAAYALDIAHQRAPGLAVPLAMLRGVLHAAKGEHVEALRAFQAVLRSWPAAGTDIRLAIGFQWLALKRTDLAQKAFERALGMDAECNEARVALARVLLMDGSMEAVHRAMGLLKTAYERDKDHPATLFFLATHFYYRRELAKAEGLCRAALNTAGGEMETAIKCLLGRICHAQGRWMEAKGCYEEAASHPMARIGLAQLHLQRGELRAARELLGPFRGKHASVDKLLALVSVELEECGADEVATLKRAAADDDRLAWLALAMALERSDAEGAIAAYEHSHSDSWQVAANRAALMAVSGRSREGVLVLAELDRQHSHPALRFDHARALEECGRLPEARAIYTALCDSEMGSSSRVRLALIDHAEGRAEVALDGLKGSLGADQGNRMMWAILASLHRQAREARPARKALERILTHIDRHDVYALTALGHLALEGAPREAGQSSGKRAAFRRALEFYTKALALAPGNWYAAHGLAVLLAEAGSQRAAKDILLQLPEEWEVLASLGHCLVELGQHGPAIRAYRQLLPLADEKTRLAVHSWLGRAHFRQGRAELSPAALKAAIDCTQLVLQSSPLDRTARCNLATVWQERAAVLLRQGQSSRSELGDALGGLETACSLYTALAGEETRPALPGDLHEKARGCTALQSELLARMDAMPADDAGQAHRTEQQAAPGKEEPRGRSEREGRAKDCLAGAEGQSVAEDEEASPLPGPLVIPPQDSVAEDDFGFIAGAPKE